MKTLELTKLKSFRNTTFDEIVALEQQINIRLPKDYVEFLLRYNGGRPKKNSCDLIEVIDTIETTCGISWFYTLAEDYNYNLFENYQIFLNRMPKELIPIASDGCGNQICLAVQGDNYGKVYFWDHDWEHDEGEEPTYRNIYLIANSFTEFVNKLYEYKLEDES